MTTRKIFNEPIIRTTSSLTEENIYGFRRRTVFAPQLTGNHTIKFCTVTGPCGAASQNHTHRGDEIVFTLEGRNINFSGTQTVIVEKNQGIAIPPYREHTTRVVETLPWKGVSFYCDDCPLLKNDNYQPSTGIVRSSLNISPTPFSEFLQKQVIFSPHGQETHFLKLLAYCSNTRVAPTIFLHPGETVYYLLSGTLFLCWDQKRTVLNQGMAAVIPAGFPHQLGTENTQGCKILAGSCSSCRFL